MKILLLIIGSISMLLGAIGVILPILPTTPFLIVAALCFAKSSSRLYNMCLQSKLFGPYIKNWYNHTGISKKEKRNMYLYVWVTMSITIYIVSSLYIKMLLVGILLAIHLHIFLLKKRNESNGYDKTRKINI